MTEPDGPSVPSTLHRARMDWQRKGADFLVDPNNPLKARAERKARLRYDLLMRLYADDLEAIPA